MPVPMHLDEAAARLEAARQRLELARQDPQRGERLEDWLDALTDFALALSEVQRFANESVHEKLHVLAGGLRMTGFPSDVRPPGR